jgi:ribosomal protein L11 methyltransferase
MNYYVFDIVPLDYSEEQTDILASVLGEMPFNTFEETEEGLKAYISESDLTQGVENQLVTLSTEFNFVYNKAFIPYQNWNEIWESNFEPIEVDDFVYLRADFHPHNPNVQFELTINPKMAFGTGHHATTYMMMQMMREVDFVDKKVLDYGCGTGILAILASKLKASTIEAVDIELPSFENTIENCAINQVQNVIPFHGTLDAISNVGFDVILANINRNVILDSLVSLKNKLNTVEKRNPDNIGKGVILFSGFLTEDEAVMMQAIENQGFTLIKKLERTNWLCLLVSEKESE